VLARPGALADKEELDEAMKDAKEGIGFTHFCFMKAQRPLSLIVSQV
jgi:hypothetical protein